MARTIMKPQVFERILAEVAKHMPPFRVASLYQGGEPFLNKNFLSMVRRVKDLGMPLVKTVSNGMLIKPEMCDPIATSGLDQIEISLDGQSPEENNEIRRRASYDHISRIVRELVAASRRTGSRLKVAISTTQFRSVRDLHIDEPAVPPEYLRRAFGDILDEISWKPNWAKLWPSGEPRTGYDLLHDDRPRTVPHNCSLLDEMVNFRADGSVVACCYDLTSITNFGNIMEMTLDEIWNGAVSRRFREDFAAARYSDLCSKCIVVTGDKFLIKKDNSEPQATIPLSLLERP